MRRNTLFYVSADILEASTCLGQALERGDLDDAAAIVAKRGSLIAELSQSRVDQLPPTAREEVAEQLARAFQSGEVHRSRLARMLASTAEAYRNLRERRQGMRQYGAPPPAPPPGTERTA